jgi:RNA polymerase sigma-70 factor (ECF subfamily)
MNHEDALTAWPIPVVRSDDRLARAFEERLAESTTLAFRVAYAVLRRREDAEDVAQEVLAKACRRLASLREPTRLRAWLVRAAWRRAIDRQRSDRRRQRWEGAAALATAGRGEPTAFDLAASAELEARLWRAIDALPEKLRLVLVLSAMEGHDVRDVAALLGVPDGTVKSRLYLARQALAEKLR